MITTIIIRFINITIILRPLGLAQGLRSLLLPDVDRQRVPCISKEFIQIVYQRISWYIKGLPAVSNYVFVCQRVSLVHLNLLETVDAIWRSTSASTQERMPVSASSIIIVFFVQRISRTVVSTHKDNDLVISRVVILTC